MTALQAFDRAAGGEADSEESLELGSDAVSSAVEVVHLDPGCTAVASEEPVLVLVQDFADTADLAGPRDYDRPVTAALEAVLALCGSYRQADVLV
jgi:hypothetical protein